MTSLVTPRTARLAACASLAGALLIAAGCEAPDVGPARAQAQDDRATADQEWNTALDCYLEVRERTSLYYTEALELCFGSRSLGPYQCYRQAQRRTLLQDGLRIALCRCAEGTAPVTCYRRFRRETVLDEFTVVNQCRPIVARQLTNACIPIRKAL